MRFQPLGLRDFGHGPIGSALACEHNRIDAGQEFPALVGDEPNIVVGVDFDVVDVLDATDLLFVGAVEKIPAVVHGELWREMTARFGNANLAAALGQIIRGLHTDLISANHQNILAGRHPLLEKVVDHHDVDVGGIGNTLEHVLRHLRYTPRRHKHDIGRNRRQQRCVYRGVEPDVDAIFGNLQLIPGQHVRDLLPAWDHRGKTYLAADPAPALAQGHTMPGKRGAPRRFQPCQAGTHDQHLFGIVLAGAFNIDANRLARHPRVDDTTSCNRSASCRAHVFVHAAAAIGEALAYFIELSAPGFADDVRIGDHRPTHAHEIDLAQRDQIVRHDWVFDPAYGADRDRDERLHGLGQMRVATLRLIHWRDGEPRRAYHAGCHVEIIRAFGLQDGGEPAAVGQRPALARQEIVAIELDAERQ